MKRFLLEYASVPHHKGHPIKPHHRTHMTPKYVSAFIERMLPIAREVKKKHGVPIAVTIAQASQESGWGQNVKGNAYFGVKGHAPTGNSTTFVTHENIDGKAVSIHEKFRAYTSLEDAADDYGHMMANNHRFRPAFAHPDNPDAFVEHIAKYATDPDYGKHLKAIIRSHNLARYDTEQPTK